MGLQGGRQPVSTNNLVAIIVVVIIVIVVLTLLGVIPGL
jgi:hypothetical protein